jgi:hypothetical protein
MKVASPTAAKVLRSIIATAGAALTGARFGGIATAGPPCALDLSFGFDGVPLGLLGGFGFPPFGSST